MENLSESDFQTALNPVELEKPEVKVKIQKEALTLFHNISIFSKRDDIPRCRRLIANYLIYYAEQEENNRDEVDRVIEALEIKSRI